MRIWAIADLHLGISTGKWMDIFGEHWKDHHLKVEAAWRDLVAPSDIVVLPGDFSWAMKAEDAAADLRWLAALPGRKVLTKGNHDYWWPASHTKMAALLPPGVHAIKRKAVAIDGVPFIGVRGADFNWREDEKPGDLETRFVRERGELIQSIEDLPRVYVGRRPPIALFHYPPFPIGRTESFFTRILEDAGCRLCVFGHLHTKSEWERVFQGESRGIRYRLVSCDSLDFRPLLLDEV
ncbi:MAG TPA: metallophosphoesterase [Planctomycetota bacterium]|nr:metallophosphoesterase [Planctomycetota bacterium]